LTRNATKQLRFRLLEVLQIRRVTAKENKTVYLWLLCVVFITVITPLVHPVVFTNISTILCWIQTKF